MFIGIDEEKDDVDLFTQSDWGVSTAKNIPAAIVRSAMRDRGFTPGVIESLTNTWVRQTFDNDKARSSTKSNVLRSFRKPVLSWGTLGRFVQISPVKHVTVYAVFEWNDGVQTISKHIMPGSQFAATMKELEEAFEADGVNLHAIQTVNSSNDELKAEAARYLSILESRGLKVCLTIDGEFVEIN